MNKRAVKQIRLNGCEYYGINTVSGYIKGDKLENQINVRTESMGLYSVWFVNVAPIIMTEAQIIELTK